MLPRLLFLLAACGPPPEDSTAPATGTPAGTVTGSTSTGTLPTGTTTPSALTVLLFGPPEVVDPDGGDQHHATVALDGTGATWVGYVRDNTVRTRILDDRLVDDSAPIPFNHPQVAAADGRVVGIATLTAGGANLQSWTEDGAQAGPPTWLDATVGGVPDLALRDAAGVAAWTDGSHLGLSAFDLDLAAVIPLPDAPPLDPGHTVSTLAVDLGPGGGWVAWSEAATGTPATLVLAPLDPATGAGAPTALTTVIDPTWDARPDVLATDAGALLAWRGATGPTLPRQAWVGSFVGGALTPRTLGGEGADQPDLARAGGLVAATWTEGERIWLELLADDGASLGPAVELTTADEPAKRPAVALAKSGDTWLFAVTWEVELASGRELRVRRGAVQLTPG